MPDFYEPRLGLLSELVSVTVEYFQLRIQAATALTGPFLSEAAPLAIREAIKYCVLK